MIIRQKWKSGRPTKRLYFSAKISDYQFKKVLWHFTLDHSAAETAKQVKLSANSISAIFGKLRKFFFEHELFRDPYRGRDPKEGFDIEGFADIEHLILIFHLKRISEKRGKLRSEMDEPDYHFAESNWRFDFHSLKAERGADFVHRMMYENLLEFVRRFGPVGSTRVPSLQERRDGRALADDQLNRIILWLERNSAKFRDPEERAELRKLREDG